MIPKIIHYCWFGHNPLPGSYQCYIESWRKYCPNYVIKEWNEDNFDVSQNQYCLEAYQAGKWAFVSDYARLQIIYNYGGIYLDTDVELIKPIDDLIFDGCGFIGFQNYEQVTTGLGFAAPKKSPYVKAMLSMYEARHFLKTDGSYDLTPCPVANTVALLHCGMKTGKKATANVQRLNGIRVLPVDYLNPQDVDTGKISITNNTYSIHHYTASWYSDKQNNFRKIKRVIPAGILHCRTLFISKRAVDKMNKVYGDKLLGTKCKIYEKHI